MNPSPAEDAPEEDKTKSQHGGRAEAASPSGPPGSLLLGLGSFLIWSGGGGGGGCVSARQTQQVESRVVASGVVISDCRMSAVLFFSNRISFTVIILIDCSILGSLYTAVTVITATAKTTCCCCCYCNH